jgi:hypothetical protein
MGSAKHGGRVLVLVALGAMAFFAAGAQAQLPGESKAGSFSVNSETPSEDPITGEQLGSGYLLVQTRNLKIECTGATVNAGVINDATKAKVTVTFTGCVANNHAGAPLKGCAFKELETIKAAALALPIVHGGERFVLFEPLEGKLITVISFKPETVCTLPLNNPVTGSVAAKVEALEGETLTPIFSEAIQLLSGDVLKYGALANTSYLNGIGDAKSAVGFNLGIH